MKTGTSSTLFHFSLSLPKKAYFITFIKDAKVNILASTAQKAYPKRLACTHAIIIINLLQKPLKGGIPAIDIDAIRLVVPVIGIFVISPPIFCKSRVPVAYSTAPEFKNSNDLNTE